MTTAPDLKTLRSAAAAEEEAGYAAWMTGHYSVAIRYWARAARHTLAARKRAKGESR